MEFPTDTDFRDSGRWHVSRSNLTATVPVTTVAIASEYSWLKGYARFGIHIGAKNNNIKDGYSWWGVGAALDIPGQEGARCIDANVDTAYPFSTSSPAWLAGLGYALLRDVREPAEQIFDFDLSDSWYRIIAWRGMLLHRAATFYGTDSSHYKALYALVLKNPGDELAALGLSAMDVLPRWRHIQSRMLMAGKPYEDQVIWRSVFY